MPFDPERWLEAAGVCCIEIPEVDREALLRTALNRAYYAALLSFKYRVEAVQGAGAVPERRTHEAIYLAVGRPARRSSMHIERCASCAGSGKRQTTF
jgi:hypothetical protein